MLPVHIGKVGVQKYTGVSRATNLLVVTWYPTFPYQRDAINWYARWFGLRNLFFSQKGHLCGGCLRVSHRSMLLACMCSGGGVEQGIPCSTRALWLLLGTPLTIGQFVAPPRTSFAVVKFHFRIMLGTP